MTSGFSEFLGAKRKSVPYHEHDASEVTGLGSMTLIGSTIDGIVGGNGALQSPNFVTGVSGWKIAGDGSAEFQSVIVRGTINADDITVGTLSVDRIAAGSITGDKIGDNEITLNLFASSLSPVQVVGSLPLTPPSVEGDMAYLTTDNKLYRHDGVGWIAVIDGADVVGTVATAGGIPTGGALPGTGSAGDLFFLTTDEKLYRHNGTAWILAVDGADVATGTLPADKIIANSITTGQIQAGAIDADRITANSITTTQIQAAGIDADRLTANSITAGQIQAGAISATELSSLFLVVGQVIQSTVYTPGSAGWQIAADGSAEFNNVTVRGSIIANSGTINDLTLDGDLNMPQSTGNPGAPASSSRVVFAASGTTPVEGVMAVSLAANEFYINFPHDSTAYPTRGYISHANASLFIKAKDLIEIGYPTTTTITIQATTINLVGSTSFTNLTVTNNFYAGVYIDITGNPTWAGLLRGADGSVGAPFYSFANDPNTGIYRYTTDGIGIAGGGSLIVSMTTGSVSFNTTSLSTSGQFVASGLIRTSTGGSAAAPGIQIGGSAAGFYQSGGILFSVTGNVERTEQGSAYFGPTGDNTYDLGATTRRWKVIHMVGGTGTPNAVHRDASGRLVVASSSRRFKEDISYDGFAYGTDWIKRLRPITFRWKDREDISTAFEDRWDIGLLAEDVARLPEDRLVTHDDEGPLSVRYELLTVPLIAAFQELEARVAALENT